MKNWLRAELSVRTKVASTNEARNRETHAKTLDHWKQDADLASIRDIQELAKLPEVERKDWQALWADVDALLAKVSLK